MLDHIGLVVKDLAASRALYDAMLRPLGAGLILSIPAGPGLEHLGYGADGKPWFWVTQGAPASGPIHLAFTARTHAEVDAFHAAALAAGARDNGPPGIRAHYHPTYYGAFIWDLDGNNLEAVCHRPE